MIEVIIKTKKNPKVMEGFQREDKLKSSAKIAIPWRFLFLGSVCMDTAGKSTAMNLSNANLISQNLRQKPFPQTLKKQIKILIARLN